MSVRQLFIERLRAFLDSQAGLGRGEFGRLAVGDRDFVRDVEAGQPVTLGRIETAEAFIATVEADPSALDRLRSGDRGRQERVAEPSEEIRQPLGVGGAS